MSILNRDQTVLGTKITHLSQSQPSIGASQPSLPVVQDVASRRRSPSPLEGHLSTSSASVRMSKAHHSTSFDQLRSSGDASFFATSGSREVDSIGRQLPERKKPLCMNLFNYSVVLTNIMMGGGGIKYSFFLAS